MAKVIMIQGTMSGAGKSLIVAGLCRIMKRDGYRVAPFKSQNMALNSFITKEGLEMGRAQVMQAEAAGIDPLVCMNPILLKPTSHTGSQVIVNGKVLGNMSARAYFAYKRSLIPEILKAFRQLEELADIIVIEGAGSPAEINLRENDIVNMGLAELVDAPVLLVGDIDRGGVFAQLLGTLMLLSEEERQRVKGLIINKFRGDPTLLDSGIEILEQKGGIPVAGVVPYMEVSLEDEDSLTERFGKRKRGKIDLAVIRYPRISNFTDFNVFEQIPDVSLRYVTSVADLGEPDLIFLPGSKNTLGDLEWMRENGLEDAVKKRADRIPICGICGGYQMMGEEISDPEGLEMGGTMRGMELLPIATQLQSEKIRRQVRGTINEVKGFFSVLSGLEFEGYEIHMGQSVGSQSGWTNFRESGHLPGSEPIVSAADGGMAGSNSNICGTYIHGIFDKGTVASALVRALAERKGIAPADGTGTEICMDYRDFKEKQYDKLADALSQYLDMEEIYGMLREAKTV
ncbi:MAG: cobyric acid synthase [Lachnospiraceae bacterium]|nr:cobyric acid synthase [Butyrivibrio sp.]MCM1344878.1 cobyric acid synthase [Muribaculaceae bacterium]MCM1411196.1 cobyric acid synthase [Lachnospiraceae bacterium]